MKRKGFTLIELLAVIVILAVIALIATPLVMNTIEVAKEGALKTTANNLMRVAELEYHRQEMDDTTSEPNIDFTNLDYKGQKIEKISGSVNMDGSINIALYQDGICAFSDDVTGQIVIDKSLSEEECLKNLPTQIPIGTVTEQLLQDNTTYSYMNGTYLSGIEKSNYVWYNGFIWRIMGKNADGSIRLITEENVSTLVWGPVNGAQDYHNSYIKKWLNDYFFNQLKNTDDIVATDFCEDRTFVGKEDQPRTTCSQTVKANVGLLSVDEYRLSGEGNSYLKNGQYYWMLTPYSAAKAWCAHHDGTHERDKVEEGKGVRAVLSVSPDMVITSGNGTLTGNQDTEYLLNQTKRPVTGTLAGNVGSGEYVTFDGRLYRIGEHTNDQVKLVLDGFYKDDIGYGTDFKDMGDLIASSSFLKWLLPTKQNNVLNATWYRGGYYLEGEDYEKNFASKENPFTGKVGLLKIGEIMSGNSLTLLSDYYQKENSYRNTEYYWTLTPSSSTTAWHVYSHGYLGFEHTVSTVHYVRPVIIISSSTEILSGNGTLESPYQL